MRVQPATHWQRNGYTNGDVRDADESAPRTGPGRGSTAATSPPAGAIWDTNREGTSVSETRDSFGARATLNYSGGTATYYRLEALSGFGDISRLPITVKILLENVLRNASAEGFSPDVVEVLARWRPGEHSDAEVPFLPARVLLQDYTGVPAVVDLAAMRSAMERLGGDPSRVNPLLPADLVVDHSVTVDVFGSALAYAGNVELEYKRNRERYQLLRWAQQAFDGLSIVPPGTGICHQVNLEYLSKVVQAREVDGEMVAFPDTCVGTDSHTPMSMASAYSPGGSAELRRRARCSASRSTCCRRRWSACASSASCARARLRPTWS
jgi:hypothetical protein